MALHQQDPLHRHSHPHRLDPFDEIDDILRRPDSTQSEVGTKRPIVGTYSRCQNCRLNPRSEPDQLYGPFLWTKPQHRRLRWARKCSQTAPSDPKAITQVGLIERTGQTIRFELPDLPDESQRQMPIRRIDPAAGNRGAFESRGQSMAHLVSQSRSDEQSPQCHHSPARASRSICNPAVEA